MVTPTRSALAATIAMTCPMVRRGEIINAPTGARRCLAAIVRVPSNINYNLRNLAAVRNKEALQKLPEAERDEWQKFWEDVDGALNQLKQKKPA